jgi:hypothetical protein
MPLAQDNQPILVVSVESNDHKCSYCNGRASIGEVTHRCGTAFAGVAFKEGSGVVGRTQVDNLRSLTNLPFIGAGRIEKKPEGSKYYFLLERQPNDLL